MSEDRATFLMRGDAKHKGKAGAMNPSGKVAIEATYDTIGQFSGGIAAAQREGKWGFIDREGHVVIPFQFDGAKEFREGRAVVAQGEGQFPFKDSAGKWINRTQQRIALIDSSGSLVSPFVFEAGRPLKEGFAIVWASGQGWGAIDADGNVAISPQFAGLGGSWPSRRGINEDDDGFSEGLLAVSNGSVFGYIDGQGRFAIQPQFVQAYPFHEGVAVVHVRASVAFGVEKAEGSSAGLIDRSGKFVAPPIYDWVRPRPGGVAQVRFGDRLGYIASNGSPLTFTPSEIDQYLSRKREQLKPPPPPLPGRAIFAKAGEVEYYLRLPEGICTVDAAHPKDRRLIDEVRKAESSLYGGQGGTRTPDDVPAGTLGFSRSARTREVSING